MRFLIDRCAGRLLADWLRNEGHDVVESRELGPDPGDRALLDWAAKETRILITIDTDFGELIYLENLSHAGLVRLPDVPTRERQLIMQDLLTRYKTELQEAAIITVRGGRKVHSRTKKRGSRPLLVTSGRN
jgi:predicted nuclease of predicted toxin-antitoxin system